MGFIGQKLNMIMSPDISLIFFTGFRSDSAPKVHRV